MDQELLQEPPFQVVSSPAAGVLGLKNDQGRAMYDDAFLVGVAANKLLKMASNIFLKVPWGVGIRKNEAEMKRWVDAAVRGMRNRDMFWSILKRTIPQRSGRGFNPNAPSPTLELPVTALGSCRRRTALARSTKTEWPPTRKPKTVTLIALGHARPRLVTIIHLHRLWDNRRCSKQLQEHDKKSGAGWESSSPTWLVSCSGAVRAERIPVLDEAAATYVEVIRNTPDTWFNLHLYTACRCSGIQ